jgi:hypothetical protein
MTCLLGNFQSSVSQCLPDPALTCLPNEVVPIQFLNTNNVDCPENQFGQTCQLPCEMADGLPPAHQVTFSCAGVWTTNEKCHCDRPVNHDFVDYSTSLPVYLGLRGRYTPVCQGMYYHLGEPEVICLIDSTTLKGNFTCVTAAEWINSTIEGLLPGENATTSSSDGSVIVVVNPVATNTTINITTPTGVGVVIPGGNSGPIGTDGDVVVIIVISAPNETIPSGGPIVSVDIVNTTTGQEIPVNNTNITIIIPVDPDDNYTQPEEILLPPLSSTIRCPATSASFNVAECKYFDSECQCWTSEGLTTVLVDEDTVMCQTEHLTDFAVFVEQAKVESKDCDVFYANYDLFLFWAVVYSLAFFYALLQLFLNFDRRSYLQKWLPLSVFFFMAISLFARVLIIGLGLSLKMSSQSPAGLVFLFSMPFTFLVIAFSSVIWFWMEISQASAKIGKFLPTFRRHLLATWLTLTGIMIGMTLTVAASPSSLADNSRYGSALIVAVAGVVIFGFVFAGSRVIRIASVFAQMNSSSQVMLQKLYRLSLGSSLLFLAMAALWIYTILSLTTFYDNFAAVYSVYLAVELSACAFLILSLSTSNKPSDQSIYFNHSAFKGSIHRCFHG